MNEQHEHHFSLLPSGDWYCPLCKEAIFAEKWEREWDQAKFHDTEHLKNTNNCLNCFQRKYMRELVETERIRAKAQHEQDIKAFEKMIEESMPIQADTVKRMYNKHEHEIYKDKLRTKLDQYKKENI